MKKSTFNILITIEIIAGFISMGLLLSDMGPWCYLVAAVIFSVVLLPFFIAMKKAQKESTKAKIRLAAALVMLIPTVIAIVVSALVIIALVICFI
jgi:hypothetical protein